ncbi:MAG: response regulator [Salinirussus sp.]
MADGDPTVLIVDDEGVVADVYAELLNDEYETRVAYSGREGLEAYDQSVDVVLLDRRMPDLAGAEVLEKLRERDGESRIAMVTAVEPDFDVIDMGFDDYLVKPVTQERLRRTVGQLLERAEYSAAVQQYFALVTKRAWLETEKATHELEHNEEYQGLLERIEVLEAELEETTRQFSPEVYAGAFRDIGQPS